MAFPKETILFFDGFTFNIVSNIVCDVKRRRAMFLQITIFHHKYSSFSEATVEI